MADEQYKWLNRETAERLLRGESLEAVDACARDQAERLSRALGALSAEAAPTTGELPGEQAALAAFRKAREAAGAERTAAGRAADTSRPSLSGADAGLVRIGTPSRTGTPARGPRWGRPVRLALAAAVAAGTLGGVAMAAGGILPTPFGPEHPRPAASVSADQTSAGPLSSASPQGSPGVSPSPDVPSGGAGTDRGGAPGEAAGPDDRTGGNSASGTGDPSGSTSGSRWKDAAAACRDIRDGKQVDTGRRRVLENLAGGSARVSRYCRVLLSTVDSAGGATNGGKGDGSGDNGKTDGKGKDKGKGGGTGQGDDEGPGRGGDGHPGRGGDGGHPGKGAGGGRRGEGVAPVPSAFAPSHPARPAGTPLGTATPSPTYTAL
ncbi:hypothetical protein AB0L59_06520 [Streptomyces sp. NPDC052109]|uniref:hypothetical protein n=1 Tax=Streptomyces sp. NPDC052109 TaxID=3155527 RepID=UPI00343AA62C